MRSLIFVRLFVLASVVVTASCRAGGQEPKQDELPAQEILDRTAKVYAECKSYQDSGLVQTVFIQAKGRRTDKKPFSTAFVRPDRLRFEYKAIKAGGDEARHIVWQQGSDIQTWWDIRPGVEKPRSLEFALFAATGVSSGSSVRIPWLLMSNQQGGASRLGLGNIKRLPDEKQNNVDCYRIESTPLDPAQVKETDIREALQAKGVTDDVIQKLLQAAKMAPRKPQNTVRGPQTLWIDKATLLIRRVDEQTTFENFQTETTTTYEPVINGTVSEERLAFNPSKR